MDIEITIPDGKSGYWEVETFTVGEDDAKCFNLQQIFSGIGGRGIKPGQYKRLLYKRQTIMSNTPAEIGDHLYFIREAAGNVLINGLGLGVVLVPLLEKKEIVSITVIEKEQDVINLVAPYFNDPRLTIIQADALTWQPPKGVKYDYVWHDIWPTICSDNLEEMKILHRKYGKRTSWQDSWCRAICELERRRGY